MREAFTRKPSPKHMKKVVVDLVGGDAATTLSDEENKS